MTAKFKTIDPAKLHDLLEYNPETGSLVWKCRKALGRAFRFAGMEAMESLNMNGYRTGRIYGIPVRAHQVIWAMQTGAWAEHDIDHINGNKTDNRFANLRAVERSVNNKNLSIRSDNTSGVAGVVWEPTRKRWCARIMGDGKNRALGRFKNLEDAREARKAAEIKYGYHANHGRSK